MPCHSQLVATLRDGGNSLFTKQQQRDIPTLRQSPVFSLCYSTARCAPSRYPLFNEVASARFAREQVPAHSLTRNFRLWRRICFCNADTRAFIDTHHSLSCRAHARHLNAKRCFTAFSMTGARHFPVSCRANARHLNARRCFTAFSMTSTHHFLCHVERTRDI